mgnify:CR=1 FL=1
MLLGGEGFEVSEAENGTQALTLIEQQDFDLIILDIMMPGEDGYTVLEKIKAMPEVKDVPVIMVTAKGAEFDKVKGLDMGADDYITKPFNPLEVVARVKTQLRRFQRYNPAIGQPQEKNSLISAASSLTKTAIAARFLEKSSLSLPSNFPALVSLRASRQGREFRGAFRGSLEGKISEQQQYGHGAHWPPA